MWFVLMLSVAFGADLDRYPVRAALTLSGPSLVSVPPALRSHADPENGSDLLLVDASGRPVPVAWARGASPPERIPLQFRPTMEQDRYALGALDRAIDGVDVLLPADGMAATVQLHAQVAGAFAPVGEPTLVWRTPESTQGRVSLPSTRGPLQATLTWHGRRSPEDPTWTGLRETAGSVEPDRLRLAVTDQRVEEGGWARYTVPLPAALPVRALTLHPVGEVFNRGALVRAEALEPLDWRSAEARIQRLRIGTAAVDQTRFPVRLPPTRTLIVYVETSGLLPLDIPEVTVELDGLAGLVPEPGEGPHWLYGGAPAGTSPPSDLQLAVPELWSMVGASAEVGAVEANPAFVPPDLRSGVSAPGPALGDGWAWRRAITGSGLVRIPLDAHVAANARPDRADLRIVDAQGRQIPYLMGTRPSEVDHGALPFTRVEEGGLSRITIEVPDPRVPLSTLTLSTDSPLFQRRVTLERARGSRLEPLRSFEWVGADRPVTMTLDVGAVIGDRLLVTIDNGANPPLPITGVRGTWPRWEVVARLPDGGAELWYGSPRATAPRYDLAEVRDDVLARATVEATLDAPREVAPPERSWWDRLIVLAGLGVLGLGLLALTISLLRAVPEPESSEGEAAPET